MVGYGISYGRFHCMDSFLASWSQLWILVSSFLQQDEFENPLDWHYTLAEVLDLTPPFAGDLACSCFWIATWQILLIFLNVHWLQCFLCVLQHFHYKYHILKQVWHFYSAMTLVVQPGLASSSKQSRQRLNSVDHFATVKYFGLLSPYTSAMCWWISLTSAHSLVRNIMIALYSIFWLI